MSDDIFELIKRADDFDWRCEDGGELARELIQTIELMMKELRQERKDSLRASYERDEAIREIGMEARKRELAQHERDDAILRAEAAERKLEKLRRITGNAAAVFKEP